MNIETESVLQIVQQAISELNEELEYEHLNEVDRDTPIFEGDLALDSLSLVTLVVDIEDKISDVYDCDVVLASDKAMSMLNSPYRNVGALTDFILAELESAKSLAS